MKKVDQLWSEHKETIFGYNLMDSFNFMDALKEHDKEIVKMIDDKILKRKKKIKPYGIDDYIDALREIKNEIEKK